MTKLLLAAATLFLSVGTAVQGLGDESTKQLEITNTKQLRGRVLQDTCSFDFSKATSGSKEYNMKVELGDPASYLKVTVTDGPFKGIFKAWCIDYTRHIGLQSYAADIVSAYDAKLQPGGMYPDAVDKPENIRSLAWLINHYKVGDMYKGTNCNAQITMGDLQNAFWTIVDVDNMYKTNTGGYGAATNVCIAQQLAAEAVAHGKDYKLSCSDPNEQIPIIFIVDDANNKIQNQVLMAQFYVSEIVGLAPPPETRTVETYECPTGSTKVKVDFNSYSSGLYLTSLTSTLSVTAKGNSGAYTPSGKARIFDSKNPTGSVDLGTPNYSCDVSGPGQGEGGRKGRPGENCKFLDKLLIIQQGNKSQPDANDSGGKFTFKTNGKTEVTLLKAGVIDIDETTVTIGTSTPVKFPGVGDNGFQEIINPNTKNFATTFDVAMPGSGAVAYLEICERPLDLCPDDSTKTEPGVCGCGVSDVDTDMDGTVDCKDECPLDSKKTKPGTCGCGKLDVDSDGDGVMDCNDLCPTDKNKIAPGVCGCGVSEMDTDGDGTPDCKDKCPADALKTEPGKCGCGIADVDSDGDGVLDCNDLCPDSAMKSKPGVCGCDMADTDTDGDGAPDCVDECPKDATMTKAGVCGCGVSDIDSDMDGTPDCLDKCPMDAKKTQPGVCGCGVPDTDTDRDGTPDCRDECPKDATKTKPGQCGCGKSEKDTDGDGTPDCIDLCPADKNKIEPGQCGCGKPDIDSDGDGTADCVDLCPNDKDKVMPGTCGCGKSDVDTDGDGTSDCVDKCPLDKEKTEEGVCGCGMKDWDTDRDGTPDCLDQCPDSEKTEPGICGCDVPDVDTDKDGSMDCVDGCPMDASKVNPGVCGCGTPDVDTDGDGVMDCKDKCPTDKEKSEPGVCGCGVSDMDSDGDGTLDCNDKCPEDPVKTQPGVCGCGVSDMDSDGDGTPDCNDNCPMDASKTDPGACGCGVSDADTDGDGIPDCKEPDDKTIEETKPPKQASTSGDPHFKTWTGDKFDYHGECDLVLVDNPAFANGLGMRVHIRTTRIKYFSYIEQIALQIGNDVLEFNNDVDNFLINGAVVEAPRKYVETTFSGFPVRRDKKAISIRLNEDSKAKIDFIARGNGFPAIILDAGSDRAIFDGSLGLLGEWKTGMKLARDGATDMDISNDATAFALEWQVRDTEPMLFQFARFPQYPTTCVPPAKSLENRLGMANMRMKAEQACANWKDDMEDCIFDVIATRSVVVAADGNYMDAAKEME